MLLPEEVKPFICNEEKIVREHAVNYLANSFNHDDDIMPLVIESCNKFGEKENGSLLSMAKHFTQSETGLRTILEWLEKTNCINTVYIYNGIISQADLDLLKPLIPEIYKYKNISDTTEDVIKRRLSFADCSTLVLWDELFDYCNEIKHKRLDQIYYPHGLHIIEALAKRDDLPVEELLEYLEDDKNFYRYDELYMTILAGEVQLEETIPILFEKLRLEADLICEEAANALIKIGTENVIRQLKDIFLDEGKNFRLFGAHIFGDIKMPLAESTLLDTLPVEKDKEIKTFLAKGVCDLVSEKGIPEVKLLIDKNDYDSGIMDLRKHLYASCRMLQVDLEELDQWGKELYHREQVMEERIRAMNKSFHSLITSDGKKMQSKTNHKIGRNEPCTCGSGKKYKKCCGRS